MGYWQEGSIPTASCRICRVFLHMDTAISMLTVNWFWTSRPLQEYQSWITYKQAQYGCYSWFELEKGKGQYNSWLSVRQASFFNFSGKLKPCPKIGLLACRVACSDMRVRVTTGLKHSLYNRPLWQSSSWLMRGILPLSHYSKHQMPFTTVALYALCSLFYPFLQGSDLGLGQSSLVIKQKNRNF